MSRKYKVDNLAVTFIPLGRSGEHDFEINAIAFDVSSWKKLYPSGRVSILYQRPDGALYPVVVASADNPVIWTPTSTDLYIDPATKATDGQLELRIMDGDVIGKSIILKTRIEASLGEPGEAPPAPEPGWVDEVIAAAGEAKTERQGAEDARNAAEEAAGDAAASEWEALQHRDAAALAQQGAEAAQQGAEDAAEQAGEFAEVAEYNKDATASIYNQFQSDRGTLVATLINGKHNPNEVNYSVIGEQHTVDSKAELDALLASGRAGAEDMHPNEACNGLVKEGLPPLAADSVMLEMPDAADYANANATRLLAAAKPFLGWTWARLHTVDEIKATLMSGIRCIVCLPYIGVVNGRWLVNGTPKGYHEMAFGGWKRDGWKVRNSWGKKKDTGFLSSDITEDGYVTIAFDDIFACNDVIALFPPKLEDEKNDGNVVARRTIRLKDTRMTGEDVTYAQQRLVIHGYAISVDGIFGPATDKAVKAFQLSHGLTVDGVIGPITWASLEKDPDQVDPQPDPDPDPDPDIITALKKDFRGWLFEQLGKLYCLGGTGETAITESIIKSKENSSSNANRVIKLWQKLISAGVTNIRMFDCSGLIDRWLIDHAIITKRTDCDGLWRLCTPVVLTGLQPLDLVYRGDPSDFTHVGVYMGDGLVIEAKGRDDGVVIRGIYASGKGYWTYAGRLKCLTK